MATAAQTAASGGGDASSAVPMDKLQERKVNDLVMNDVGLNGDIAMRVSRALRLAHTNKVRRRAGAAFARVLVLGRHVVQAAARPLWAVSRRERSHLTVPATRDARHTRECACSTWPRK